MDSAKKLFKRFTGSNLRLAEQGQFDINKVPDFDMEIDITYRISGPYNFDSNFNSSLLFIFGTCEQKFLDKGFYINGSPEILSKEKKIFIHTPSNWSKEGFIKALVVLIPTYITALLTDKMVYVIPMLAAVSFIAAGMFNEENKRRLEEDGYKKDAIDLGSRKDDG